MSAQGKAHPKRKPWTTAHQTVMSCTILIALIAATIFGIGWRDGYWSKSQAPAVTKGKGP